jgi:hypothetical protein
MRKVLLLVLLAGIPACAQNVGEYERGTREIGAWVSGGHGVSGGFSADTSMISAGMRMGWIVFGPHGGGFMRGNFEYAFDIIPLQYLWQPGVNTNTYGGGFNGAVLKWNFVGKYTPYAELAGGALFTPKNVPPGTNTVNFSPQGAFGFQIPIGAENKLDLSIRYVHISNAGLERPNPGLNFIQGRLGIMFWNPNSWQPKHRRR